MKRGIRWSEDNPNFKVFDQPDIPGGASLTQDATAPEAEARASQGKSAKADKSQAAKAIEAAVNNTSSEEGLGL